MAIISPCEQFVSKNREAEPNSLCAETVPEAAPLSETGAALDTQ